jgi:NADH dehydrogenase
MKRVVIVGGGFAGVRTAVALARARVKDLAITLVSDKSHFDYYPSMFHLLNGHSIQQLAIPLSYIFEGTGVQVEHDTITHIDFAHRMVCTRDVCKIRYDYLVIATGSMPNFSDVQDMKNLFHTISTVDEVLRLRRDIFELVTRGCFNGNKASCGGEIIVVGAGATGVEAAAEIAMWGQRIAREYQVPKQSLRVRLLASGDRVAPQFSQQVSNILAKKLRDVGVCVEYGRRLTRLEVLSDHIHDMREGRKIIIWAAGLRLAPLVEGLQLDKDVNGKLVVNDYLQVMCGGRAYTHVFAGGDVAATKYSGLAQTAMRDAGVIARNITASSQKRPLEAYTPLLRGSVLAMGNRWAVVVLPWISFAGWIGCIVRMFVDFKSFVWLLPLPKALTTFLSGQGEWREFEDVARNHMLQKYHRYSGGTIVHKIPNERIYSTV